jgi:hypothetical protein
MDTRRSYYLAARKTILTHRLQTEIGSTSPTFPTSFRLTITRGPETVCQLAAALCFVV